MCVSEMLDIFKKEKQSNSKQRVVTEDGWQDGLLVNKTFCLQNVK